MGAESRQSRQRKAEHASRQAHAILPEPTPR